MQWQVQLQLYARSDQPPLQKKRKKKVTLFPVLDILPLALSPFALSLRNSPNLTTEAFSFL